MRGLIVLSTFGAAMATTYQLRTALKPDQPHKTDYDKLWLSHYHTGAGLNDVVFSKTRENTDHGFLSDTNATSSATPYYNQLFDLGTEFTWGLQMDESDTSYAAWQPVRLNAGVSGNKPQVYGFFINGTGLQWTSSLSGPGSTGDAFGGWLVCDWWHGAPQLFFRLHLYDKPAAPASCAEVYLLPVES